MTLPHPIVPAADQGKRIFVGMVVGAQTQSIMRVSLGANSKQPADHRQLADQAKHCDHVLADRFFARNVLAVRPTTTRKQKPAPAAKTSSPRARSQL